MSCALEPCSTFQADFQSSLFRVWPGPLVAGSDGTGHYSQPAPTARSMQGKVLALEGCVRERAPGLKSYSSFSSVWISSFIGSFPFMIVCAEVQSRLAIRTTDRRVCERTSEHGLSMMQLYKKCSTTKVHFLYHSSGSDGGLHGQDAARRENDSCWVSSCHYTLIPSSINIGKAFGC